MGRTRRSACVSEGFRQWPRQCSSAISSGFMALPFRFASRFQGNGLMRPSKVMVANSFLIAWSSLLQKRKHGSQIDTASVEPGTLYVSSLGNLPVASQERQPLVARSLEQSANPQSLLLALSCSEGGLVTCRWLGVLVSGGRFASHSGKQTCILSM